uniref:Glycosyltransferase n=1 Tax=Linum usitatissimum TaxID=4006 RepID=I6YI14_LINUS|nr:putative UDP-glucosyltransferase [Linum usitatissimum]
MIPMVDIAKLLATRGAKVTIVTTPVNAARFKSPIRRSNLRIDLVELRFPGVEAGLPEGCENVDLLPSFAYIQSMMKAAAMMEPQEEIARMVGSDQEYFVLPGMPGEIKFSNAQLPLQIWKNGHQDPEEESRRLHVMKVDSEAYGVIVNSFEELEPEYFSEYKNSRQGKIWCVGPVSLTNLDELDKIQRGNYNISLTHESLEWLNTKESKSVLYICLGSICNLSSQQLIELALGLEASETPFVWAIREKGFTKDLFTWITNDGFENRVAGRGLLIKGWAPQLSILSHSSVGGFLTHCGWNSSLEGISAGIPLVTWPLFGDQFSNEKLIVDVLKIGVRIGAEKPTFRSGKEETTEVSVRREDVERAVRLAMEGGKDGDRRRKRTGELAGMAWKAVERGGSSYKNVDLLIQDIAKHQEERRNHG